VTLTKFLTKKKSNQVRNVCVGLALWYGVLRPWRCEKLMTARGLELESPSTWRHQTSKTGPPNPPEIRYEIRSDDASNL
jgi:hypothetical protein